MSKPPTEIRSDSPSRDFLWGAATSAYQIEGSPLADGAGPSIWHRFANTPGRVLNGDTGDIACDHYRRWHEDVALMAALGVNAYRFSVAWARILPEGTGRVNQAGLDFYRCLVDALLEQGIEPMLTLYHWDLPEALDTRGGWASDASPGWFADYAQVLYRALGDRVRLWITLNEPWVITAGGYLYGDLAPGHRSLHETPIVAHNLLRAHAAALASGRAEGIERIGLAVNLEPQYPASPSAEDIGATAHRDAFINRWFLDPVFLGRYPAEMETIFGSAWPRHSPSELDALRAPPDFIGVNYYSRSVVRADPTEQPVGARRVRQDARPHTAMDWEVYPQGLTDILLWIQGRYGNPPVYITENGAAFDDPPPVAGRLHDRQRVAYLRTHLRAASRALRRGVDLRGYFAWSLLDNFEWSYGYAKRFGLVHVDPVDRQRLIKDSGRFYRDAIRRYGRGPRHGDLSARD
ncbi:GH1 family beta-glucosidase [Thiocapsa roseopersicina]|uniref:Beta-glucosidase n=1 Tax=Thiocapsa roseopersicina TaxID=1058 RepID=A0A1H2WWH7_THIRO|nr:GH1 family beta-glucosidase [Thiocapsa roseopersicina]SDW84614.1 beta-glucosidase [Thiocapsa roseopersicina]